MAVILRKRKNKTGTTSLYLDIHHNGRRYNEYLPELKLIPSNNPIDKAQNKERLQIATQIKNKRAIDLQGQDYDVLPSFKHRIDFLAYFQAFVDIYPNKDKRVIESTLFRFRKFLKEKGIRDLTSNMVNEALVEDFKNHLQSNLNGESPSNYFKKFKKVLKQATRDKIMKSNPATDIKIKHKSSIQKDTLTIAEIQQLADTPITNRQLGMAFIFCCYTGLRWCDVSLLTWKNVELDNKKLSFIQAKTKIRVELTLHEAAIQMLGSPGESYQEIFTLPSHTGALKSLKYWVKTAGIQKHITWHCARHSFATNVLFYGAGSLEVSKLLGHTSMAYTQRYVRIADSMKQRAIDNLPGLSRTNS